MRGDIVRTVTFMYVFMYVCMYVRACICTLEDIFYGVQVIIFLLSVPPGSIPPQIGNLTLLRELILLNNDLTGGDRLAEVSLCL